MRALLAARIGFMSTAIVLGGCNLVSNIANSGSPVDAKTTSAGDVVFLDTPKTWAFFRSVIDSRVEREKLGYPPPLAEPSWNFFWLDQIKKLKDGAWEHSGKYVSYIVEKRFEAGLPELKDHTPPDK